VRELEGIARFKFHDGKLDEFERVAAQSMEIVRTKDTGTLQYDIYFNDDQSECIVHERYRDSDLHDLRVDVDPDLRVAFQGVSLG
jgi:quinol monooxygenase YgiN